MKRKTTCPLGFSTRGLYFANKKARLFLSKEYAPEKIWICEGEIDYLTLAQADDITVIGVRSGSISGVQLMPWKAGQIVYIATDNDKQGNKYAEEITRNVRPAISRRVNVKMLGGK